MLLATTLAGCSDTAPAGPPQPVPAGPVTVEVRIHDLLAAGDPLVPRADLIVDGRAVRAEDGVLRLELEPGAHSLFVRDPRYEPDVAALRFGDDAEPRAQTAGATRLDFDVRPGDRIAELRLLPRGIDLRFVASLLDDGRTRRWSGPVDLDVDLSPAADGWSLAPERVSEVAAFVDSALAEVTGGALRVGRVTAGTGVASSDLSHEGRHGAVTLQLGRPGTLGAGEVFGWALYHEAAPGVIRSARIFLSDEELRRDRPEWRGPLAHEIGHAIGLQHPLPCRRWSRMDGGRRCPNDLLSNLPPGTYWAGIDGVAGRLQYALRAGTDLRPLGEAAR